MAFALLRIVPPGSTGIQDYPLVDVETGLAFAGDCAWTWGNDHDTSGGASADNSQFYGITDGTTERVVYGLSESGGLSRRGRSASFFIRCHTGTHASNSFSIDATASFSGNNLRLNWGTVTGDREVFVCVLGAVANAKVVQFAASTSPLTGVGFKGNLAISVTHCATGDSSAVDHVATIGVAIDEPDGSAIRQWALFQYYGSSGDNTERHAMIRDDMISGQMDAADPITYEIALSSFDSDGLTWTGTNGDHQHMLIVDLGDDIRADVGTFVKETTGVDGVTQQVTTEFTSPLGVFLASGSKDTEASTTRDGCTVSVGASDGSGQYSTALRTEADAGEARDQDSDATLALTLFDETSITPLASGTGRMMAGAFRVTWGVADTRATIVGFLAIGPTPPPLGLISPTIGETRLTKDGPPYTTFAGPSAATAHLVTSPLALPFPPADLDAPVAGQQVSAIIETPASGRDTEPYATFAGPSAVNAQLVASPVGGPRLSGGGPAPAPRVGQLGPTVPWFDRFWSLPSTISAGIVSEPSSSTLSIHNAHHTAREWAGLGTLPAGVTVTGVPTLPKLMQAHETIELTVQVDIAADVDLDDPIDFDTGDDPTEVVSGPRSIVQGTIVNLFQHRPERPTEEILEFGTDIITRKDGSEQRRSYRRFPRVICRYRYLRTEGVEAQRFEALLMALQNDRTVIVPMWHEERRLVTNIAVNDDGLFVDVGDYADWRLLTVNDMIAVIDSAGNFEVVKTRAVIDLGDSTHLLTTDFANAWTAGAAVVPVRRAQIDGNVAGQRWPNGMQEFRVEFRVNDNVSDLEGEAVHATFNGRVYFPAAWPLQSQTLSETYDRIHQQLDGETGLVHQESRWPHNRRSYTYTHPVETRQDLWFLRGTLHKLRGRQVAFYIREFSSGLTTTLTLPAGGTTMRVTSIDYRLMIYLGTALAQGRKMFIRVEFKSGLIETREITNAATVGGRFDEEDLTITPAWNTPFPPGTDPSPAGIERIDFIGLFRMASDRVVFTHQHPGRARVSMPVIEVRE